VGDGKTCCVWANIVCKERFKHLIKCGRFGGKGGKGITQGEMKGAQGLSP